MNRNVLRGMPPEPTSPSRFPWTISAQRQRREVVREFMRSSKDGRMVGVKFLRSVPFHSSLLFSSQTAEDGKRFEQRENAVEHSSKLLQCLLSAVALGWCLNGKKRAAAAQERNLLLAKVISPKKEIWSALRVRQKGKIPAYSVKSTHLSYIFLFISLFCFPPLLLFVT